MTMRTAFAGPGDLGRLVLTMLAWAAVTAARSVRVLTPPTTIPGGPGKTPDYTPASGGPLVIAGSARDRSIVTAGSPAL